MLTYFTENPVLRWLLWLLTGMLIPYQSLTAGLFLILAGAWLWFLHRMLERRLSASWSFRWMPGITLACFWLACGIFCSNRLHRQAEKPAANSAFFATGSVESNPVTEAGKTHFVFAVTQAASGFEQWQGKLLRITLPEMQKSDLPERADQLVMQLRPICSEPGGNPYAFDYAAWLRKQGVCAVATVKPGRWHKFKPAPDYSLLTQADRCRNSLVDKLGQSGLKGNAQALISALLLGETTQLTSEAKRSFSGAGISHILSVSGMHVALVYAFLIFLFSFARWIPGGKTLRSLLIIVLLFVYAFITGLSPSVLRAVLMLSMLVLGKTIHRRTQPLNTVLFSALILLLVHPAYLYDLGFQLSYLAVVMLVVVYPPVVACWKPKSPMLNSIWKAACLSFVAQVGTAPVTIAVFHRFPNYFLLNNLLAVPASSFLMLLGFLVLALGSLSLPGNLLSEWTNTACDYFLGATKWVADLPCSTTQGLSLTSVQVLLIYILLASLFGYIFLRRRKALYPLMWGLVGLQLHSLIHNFNF